MAGSFIAISHHGVADAHELLARLYQRTGDLSEPLADIGEGLALSHRDRWDAQETPEGEPGPLSDQVPRPQAAPCRRGAAPQRRSARHPQLSGRSPGPLLRHPLNTVPPTSSAPEINLPERPYLGLSETDQQSVLETLEGLSDGGRALSLWARLRGLHRAGAMAWPVRSSLLPAKRCLNTPNSTGTPCCCSNPP